jgi:hypothetical protein
MAVTPMLKFLIPLFLLLPGCGTLIEVQVLEKSTGKPIPGAQVRSSTLPFHFPIVADEGTTDEHGVATLRVNRKAGDCSVIAEGYWGSVKGDDDFDRWYSFLQSLDREDGVTPRFVTYVVPSNVSNAPAPPPTSPNVPE